MAITSTPTAVDPGEQVKEVRSRVRQKQLLDAAATLMQKHGARNVSVRSIAEEAGLSVGLVYRYFGNKDDLLRSLIVGVLDEMAYEISQALEPMSDPVRRIVSVFETLCRVIDNNRKATLLTYRESASLDKESQAQIKQLEEETAKPLLDATQEAIDQGLLRSIDADLFSYSLLMLAHSWALKYWHFSPRMSLDQFIESHSALALSGVIEDGHRERYADLLTIERP